VGKARCKMGKRTGIMLAYPLEEKRLTDKKFDWEFPVICQPKLDGERARAVNEDKNETTINLVSSELNDITGVPHVNLLLEALKRQHPDLPELDGELYCHNMRFPEIHSIISRGENNLHPKYPLMEYHIFDYISNEPQIERIIYLRDVLAPLIDKTSLKIVPVKSAKSLEEIMNIYQGYLKQGYEGIIVRHMWKSYIRKRSRFMLKFKPKKFDNYPIIGVEEAISKDGDSKNMIGAFVCQGSDGTIFNVGAGNLTHKEREMYWNNQDLIIGKDCLVQYQNINSATGRPRFGLCVRVID